MCDDNRCQTFDSYYDSTDVHFEDVKLAVDIEEDNVHVPFIDGIRDIFMDGIIAQIKSYFSNSDLKNFKISPEKNTRPN